MSWGKKPDYARLNVRCCCEPGKVLGTLSLPVPAEGFRHGQRVAIGLRMLDSVRAFSAPEDEPRPIAVERAHVEVKRFVHNKRGHLYEEFAVPSEDRPLEFWRQIPGFTPAS